MSREEANALVNSSPRLFSLLYDMGLTPEECEPGSSKEAKMLRVVYEFSTSAE
jgi:hypothetical protein